MPANPSIPVPSVNRSSRQLQAVGAALVLASTISIAIVPTFAKFAYDGGSNTLTVITARSLLTVALAWLLMILLRQSVRIGRKPLLTALATGVVYAVMLYGFLGAVAYIPVNTVILIFFFHPVLVGLAAVWLGDEPMSYRVIGALVVACVGLGLAIGFSFDRLNPTGLGLAFLSAVTCVFVIIGNARAMKQASSLAVVFWMMVSASVTLVVLFPALGAIALPHGFSGWLGFAGVAVGYTIGTLAFFVALPILGAVRATMISNVEPLLGIIFAVLILGERISLVQGAGIALVLAAIAAVEWRFKASSATPDPVAGAR